MVGCVMYACGVCQWWDTALKEYNIYRAERGLIVGVLHGLTIRRVGPGDTQPLPCLGRMMRGSPMHSCNSMSLH